MWLWTVWNGRNVDTGLYLIYLLAFLIQKSQGQPWPLTQAGSDPRSLWQDSRSWRLYVSMTNSQHYTVCLSGRHFTASFWRKSKDRKERMEEGEKAAGGESKRGGEARRGYTSWAGGEKPQNMEPTHQTAITDNQKDSGEPSCYNYFLSLSLSPCLAPYSINFIYRKLLEFRSTSPLKFSPSSFLTFNI